MKFLKTKPWKIHVSETDARKSEKEEVGIMNFFFELWLSCMHGVYK